MDQTAEAFGREHADVLIAHARHVHAPVLPLSIAKAVFYGSQYVYPDRPLDDDNFLFAMDAAKAAFAVSEVESRRVREVAPDLNMWDGPLLGGGH